jgi:hypothetical protein
MALYVVERDVGSVSAEQLHLDQRGVASACIQLKARGKRIRYISSAVMPAEGRALDLFGSAGAEVVKEAHAVAGVAYLRVVEILDATPTFVERGTSRPRRSLQRAVGGAERPSRARGTTHAVPSHSSSPELSRWLADGQRLFAVCLETLETFDRLQSENEMLRDEIVRLRQRADALQTERSEMAAAFQDLAGHVTEVVDHIIRRTGNGGAASK